MRTLPEHMHESSDVEDGALYVLVSPKELRTIGAIENNWRDV